MEGNGHFAWHLREHLLNADCYVNFITSVYCVLTTGQALHWAKHLMSFNTSLMCCDYILCTNEETDIGMRGQDPKLGLLGSEVCK